MPRWPRPSEQQVREWQPRFWARLIILVVLAAYVLGFILENRKQVHLHFVLFTARVSLIWLILWIRFQKAAQSAESSRFLTLN